MQCYNVGRIEQAQQPAIRKRGREVRQWRSVEVSKAERGRRRQGYKCVPDEIRATLLDYVLNHGFTMVGLVKERSQILG